MMVKPMNRMNRTSWEHVRLRHSALGNSVLLLDHFSAGEFAKLPGVTPGDRLMLSNI